MQNTHDDLSTSAQATLVCCVGNSPGHSKHFPLPSRPPLLPHSKSARHVSAEWALQLFWQVVGKALDMQRHCNGAELDPLAESIDDREAPLLLKSASPQRPPQQRLSLAASAVSSLTSNPTLLSSSGTGMMTVVKTQFVPLGDSLSDSDSDSEVIALALCFLALTLLFNQSQLLLWLQPGT